MTFLAFTEIEDTGKTKVWLVHNSNDGSRLGTVRWRGGWRKYVLSTEGYGESVWSADCLRDVAEFIDNQMALRAERLLRERLKA